MATQECGITNTTTIRHVQCEIIIGSRRASRCGVCCKYRATLRSLLSHVQHSKGARTEENSHVNYRFINKEEKIIRMKRIKRKYRNTEKKFNYMRAKLKAVIAKQGVTVDDEMHWDIKSIMKDGIGNCKTMFQKIFWDQQFTAANLSDSRQMKWHPLMIKWALYLRHQSNKCYETLREAKCIHLPSQRTLRDYTYYLQSNTGFSNEVDQELIRIAKLDSAEEFQKCVGIVIDEMHVREGLVFDKNTGTLVGFVDLGNVNNLLVEFEQRLASSTTSTSKPTPSEVSVGKMAKSMLVFFVCGLFTSLRFPFAQFPSLSLSGDLLFNPFWECVKRLEWCGFKVVATTADGAKCNRTFFRMHGFKGDVYKTLNPFCSDKRFIYFFSDPPHLLKTARNCLANSKRKMWVSVDALFVP